MGKRDKDKNVPNLYDEDGFFIDVNILNTPISSQQQPPLQQQPINFTTEKENNFSSIEDCSPSDTKDLRSFRNKKSNSNFGQSNMYQYSQSINNPNSNNFSQQEIFPDPSLDYENIVKNNIINNCNYNYNYNSEESEERNEFFDEETYRKKRIKWLITSIFSIFYLIFLVVGVLNTNLIDGYAQQINSEIKAERVVYNDVYKKVLELSSNPQFGGEIELNELENTQRYSEKKVVYSNLATKYTKEITTYQKKQSNEKNVYNQAMYEDYITLLKAQKNVLELTVSYYTALEGSISTQNLDLEKMKSNLLLADKTFSIAFNSKIQSFEDKKINLKLA